MEDASGTTVCGSVGTTEAEPKLTGPGTGVRALFERPVSLQASPIKAPRLIQTLDLRQDAPPVLVAPFRPEQRGDVDVKVLSEELGVVARPSARAQLVAMETIRHCTRRLVRRIENHIATNVAILPNAGVVNNIQENVDSERIRHH